MYRVPVLDMKKIDSTAKNALFVVIFNPQAKTRMNAAKSFFELLCYRLVAGIDV
jgi:precorrin-3B methylase